MHKSPSPINIYYKDDNDLYIGHQQSNGLHIFRNWSPLKKSSPEKWLSGSEISWMLRDRNQGLWVTTINNGIFYYPNDQVKVYSTVERFTTIFLTGLGSTHAMS